MTSHLDSEPRWRRYAAEILTIVVGILLALGADATRQSFADRASEREILAALRVEFAADVREIETDQASRAQKLAAIDLLSGVRSGTVEAPEPEELAEAVNSTMNWRFYTAAHPVLDDILSTGRLDLLRSDELRRALMAFGQERSRLAVVEQEERAFVGSQLQPYLAGRIDLEALASPEPAGPHAAAVATVPGLLTDTMFGSLLYLNRHRVENSTQFAERLLETVAAVREALGEPE